MSAEEDEDLPSILFKDDRQKSGDFSMPAADILASQRAREEECVQELLELGSKFVNQPSDSSGSDSEASLNAAVDALCVEKIVQHVHAPSPNALLRSLLSAPILQPYDLSLLNYSAILLDTNDEQLIITFLNETVLHIRQCIKRCNESDNLLGDEDTIVLCCWLCASSIWSGHQPSGTHAVLSELLKWVAPVSVETIAGALVTALQKPRVLVEASDAVWGHTLAQKRIASHLLAAALNSLAPSSASAVLTSPDLNLTIVCTQMQRMWRDLNADERQAAFMVAARVAVRNEPEPGGLESLRALLDFPVPIQPRQGPDLLEILVAASRLQILFDVHNIKTLN